MNIYFFLISLVFLSLLSCGKKDDSPSKEITQRENQTEQLGEYRAVLRSMNTSAGNHKSFGTAIISVSEENFEVKVNLIKGPSNVIHIQSIHTSGRCPNMERDKNGDGFIDLIEGSVDFGKFLIPLDGDLSSQETGSTYSPSGQSYSYSESAIATDVMKDLYSPDINQDDFYVKLKANAPLKLEGRTFVILGVSSHAKLPTTVATIQDLSSEATLPIACGEIVHINPE